MRIVRILEEVWQAIASRGKFGEKEDDVLRRILGVHEASPHTSGSSKPRPRYAEVRMSAEVKGHELLESFESGAANRWQLKDPSEKESLRRVRTDAVEWTRKNGASSVQEDAVKKALTSAGYHLRR